MKRTEESPAVIFGVRTLDSESGEREMLHSAIRRRKTRVAQLWRTMFYMVGGGLLFSAMAYLSAEAKRPLAEGNAPLDSLQPFYGVWEGTLRLSTPAGEVVSYSQQRRTYIMGAGRSQQFEFATVDRGGRLYSRSTGIQEEAEQGLLRTEESNNTITRLRGARDAEGAITWVVEGSNSTTLIREWVDGQTLYIEGVTVQEGGSTRLLTMSGRLKKQILR